MLEVEQPKILIPSGSVEDLGPYVEALIRHMHHMIDSIWLLHTSESGHARVSTHVKVICAFCTSMAEIEKGNALLLRDYLDEKKEKHS